MVQILRLSIPSRCEKRKLKKLISGVSLVFIDILYLEKSVRRFLSEKNIYRRKHIRNRFQFSVTMALKMSKIPAQSCYPTNNVTGRLFEKYADSQTVQHRSLDLN